MFFAPVYDVFVRFLNGAKGGRQSFMINLFPGYVCSRNLFDACFCLIYEIFSMAEMCKLIGEVCQIQFVSSNIFEVSCVSLSPVLFISVPINRT